jgi:hypothetical protein
MRRLICGSVLLAGASILATAGASAQPEPATRQAASTDLAITLNLERADVVPTECCFWMKGGAAEGAVTLWKGLGVAAAVTGDHVSNYSSGYNVNKIAVMAGPRYTRSLRSRYQIYGDGLFGEVHAFNGVFPSATNLVSTAGSFALETGGGVNMFVSRSFGVRLIEADYVRTLLPNGSANVQNDIQLDFGVIYHIGRGLRP